jgi:hypothetical protein
MFVIIRPLQAFLKDGLLPGGTGEGFRIFLFSNRSCRVLKKIEGNIISKIFFRGSQNEIEGLILLI